MSDSNKNESLQPADKPEDLFAVELDPRLEFGVAIVDSDLGADDNTSCHNTQSCIGEPNNGCTNGSFC
ncbi:MAG TPA: hypothetical protein VGX94_06170 [Terriglobia bacterium]|nr:hypothetical protein [Terriglobia bacterium]